MSLAVCDGVRVEHNERAPWHATFAYSELRRQQLREVERIEEVVEEVVNGWNAILHEGESVAEEGMQSTQRRKTPSITRFPFSDLPSSDKGTVWH